MHSNEPIKLTKDRAKVKDLTPAVALTALANLVARGSSRLIEAMLAVCCLAMMNDACRAAECGAPYPADAVAYWRFDNNLNDSSGGGHTLIPGTGTSFVTGKALQAGNGQGQTANFATQFHSAFADYGRVNNTPPNTWTWVGWYRRNTNVNGFRARLIQLKQSDGAWVRDLQWDVASGSLSGSAFNRTLSDGVIRGATASIAMPYTIGEWHFIVYGMDGTRVFLEVNRGGMQYATIPTSGTGYNLNLTTASIQLGGDPNQLESCHQSFDEIGIYNRLLSVAELDALYNDGIGRGFASPSNLAGGWDHSLAVKHDGTVWSWGDNYYGQLARTGLGSSPGQVTSLAWARFNAVACGGWHSLALKEDGGVWAWGYNYYGQLGDGSIVNTATPIQVKGPGGVGHLSGVIAVSAGDYNSYALKSDGTVWAWGNGGAVGNGPYNQATPVQVLDTWDPSGTLTGVIAVSGGGGHCLALKSDGRVRAWGYNTQGQLGNNTVNNSTFATKVFQSVSPTPVELSGVVGLAAGNRHSVALKCDGSVWTWGDDAYGQLGDGTPATARYFAQPIGLTGVRSISAGWDYSLATDETGLAYGWGRNHRYQLGLGGTDTATRYSPVWISTLPLVDALVAAKMSHSFGLRYDWKVLGWGANSWGQVGDTTTQTPRTSPVLVAPYPAGFGL